MNSTPLLFVYGTLKRGGALHSHLEKSAFLGTALTLPEYTLFDLGAYPGLVEGGETAVAGELYQIAADLWSHLDDIEGAPDLFIRKPVRLAHSPHPTEAYFLTNPPSFKTIITSGNYQF